MQILVFTLHGSLSSRSHLNFPDALPWPHVDGRAANSWMSSLLSCVSRRDLLPASEVICLGFVVVLCGLVQRIYSSLLLEAKMLQRLSSLYYIIHITLFQRYNYHHWHHYHHQLYYLIKLGKDCLMPLYLTHQWVVAILVSLTWHIVVGWMGPSRDVHVKTPRNYESITLHDGRHFPAVIKLRVMRWGRFLGLSWCTQCGYKCPYKRGRGVRVGGGGHVKINSRETGLEAEHALSGSEDGGRSCEPAKAGSL